MNRWQTISVVRKQIEHFYNPVKIFLQRTKDYTILKHLLSPGRYYEFRVAAVDRHGSRGFSPASAPPFKLSRQPRAPGRPRNLHVGTKRLDARGRVLQTIHWAQPNSDLPIMHYQVKY
jgi:hypothetical protein